MSRKISKAVALALMLAMLLTLLPSVSLAADATAHTHTYRLAPDSYEATDTTGGYRHYRCSVCRSDYAYYTDPLVYKVNPKTGEPLSDSGAANPYLPNYEFMPDNELHVMWSKADSEWRVYAVGSHDTKLSGWCGPDITCWSAPVYDLSDWRFEATLRDTGTYFACDFSYDLQTDLCILYAFPFFGNPEMSGTHLWTNGHSVPDTYFDTPLTEGDGVVGIDGANNFDPAIYISEGGDILTTFDKTDNGTKHAQLSKVNADRTGLEWSVPVVMAEGERSTNGFNPKHYEGSTIDRVDVNGHWFWVIQYSYKSNWTAEDYEKDVDGEQRWWPLACVYSDPDMTIDELKDFTGWHWGGIIGDNGGFFRKDAGSDTVTEHDDPTTCWGNNHGGLVYINGQWYVSNHRHTSTAAGRQGFLEKVSISYRNNVLTITTPEYTSSIGESIDAFRTWPAYIACHLWPTVFSETHRQTLYIDTPLRGAPANYWDMIYDTPSYAEHRSPVVGITDGAEVGFKYLNFGTEANALDLSVLVSREDEYVDGVLNVFFDAPSEAEGGTKIGAIPVTAEAVARAGVSETGSDGAAWSKLRAYLDKPVSGIHSVYFVFSSEEAGTICKFDEFTFSVHMEHAYRLADDSYEATATEGGYRHYVCADCGEEYSYNTDPTVYTVNPKTGKPVTLDLAANPYLPNWEFMPDNELHVMWSKADSEWRVYAVGSHDTKMSGWCGPDITCWSAPVYDLSDWRFEAILRDTGTFFACDMNYDLQTDRCVLYAFPFFGNPEQRGTHLWVNGNSVPDSYFDIPLSESGVAGIDGSNNFDPAIYISDAGEILTTFDKTDAGTKHAQLSKVNADQTGLEWSVPVVMAEGERSTNGYNPKHYEGSTIDYVEVDGHSYWVIQYSYKSNWTNDDYEKDVDGQKNWWPLAYVYSDPDMTIDELKDFTGWHWGGIIGDNGGFFRKDAGSDEVTEHDDPTTCWGNNHGGLVFINGEWFISNHRHTSTAAGRQGFIEKVSMSVEEGKLVIKPTEYTSSIGESITAYHTWGANIACHLWPTVFSETHNQTMYIENPLTGAPSDYWSMMYAGSDYAEHRSPIVGITNGAEVGFKYLDFGEDAKELLLTILVSQGEDYVDGVMDVYIDAPSAEQSGTKIGSVNVTADAVTAAGVKLTSSDGTAWSELSAKMDETVTGIHAVYFVFSSEEEGTICKLDEFTFTHYVPSPAEIAAQQAQAAAEKAKADAEAAQAAAEAAQAAAEAAQAQVNADKEAVAAAKAEAEAAKAAAETARANAEAAQAAAEAAKAAAETAKTDAEAAQAEAAKQAAKAAEDAAKAAQALSDAQAALAAAQAAAAQAAADKDAAEQAKAAAEAAQRAAEQAKALAEDADADAAQQAAKAAQSAASAARAQAAAQAAEEAAEEAAASAALDKQAAEAARQAAEAAKTAAEAAQAAAETADAAAAEKAAAAAASAADSARAQAAAQNAQALAEAAQAAAEAARVKADEAAARGDASAAEAAAAKAAAEAAAEAAENAKTAAAASAEAAQNANTAAAQAAAKAAEDAAKVAKALEEIAAARADVAADREAVEQARRETELIGAKYYAMMQIALAAGKADTDHMKPEQRADYEEIVAAAARAVEDAADKEAIDRALAEGLEAVSRVPADNCPSRMFVDAPAQDNWAHAGIDYCVENGLMNGVSDTVFSPAGSVTRAQLVTILYRAAGEPAVEFKGVFTDVADGKWYSDAIEWAAANGVVNGVGEGRFNPDGKITREQIAAILYRRSGSPKAEGTLAAFPDAASVSEYAVDAMVWATGKGLINGIAQGDVTILSPKTNASRAQIAAIIMRYLEN